ncbi:MAG: ferredoxin, partial [Rubrivivax sp.]
TCHVYVEPEWTERVGEVTHDEASMLEMTASPRRPESRLSCQIVMQSALDGLTVRLPESQY